MSPQSLTSLASRFKCNPNYNHDKDTAIEQGLFAIFTKSC